MGITEFNHFKPRPFTLNSCTDKTGYIHYGKVLIGNIQNKLANSEDPKETHDDVVRVKPHGETNCKNSWLI